jgi:hephaestin
MVPDAAGAWLYHCHVNDHIAGGMAAIYRVR